MADINDRLDRLHRREEFDRRSTEPGWTPRPAAAEPVPVPVAGVVARPAGVDDRLGEVLDAVAAVVGKHPGLSVMVAVADGRAGRPVVRVTERDGVVETGVVVAGPAAGPAPTAAAQTAAVPTIAPARGPVIAGEAVLSDVPPRPADPYGDSLFTDRGPHEPYEPDRRAAVPASTADEADRRAGVPAAAAHDAERRSAAASGSEHRTTWPTAEYGPDHRTAPQPDFRRPGDFGHPEDLRQPDAEPVDPRQPASPSADFRPPPEADARSVDPRQSVSQPGDFRTTGVGSVDPRQPEADAGRVDPRRSVSQPGDFRTTDAGPVDPRQPAPQAADFRQAEPRPSDGGPADPRRPAEFGTGDMPQEVERQAAVRREEERRDAERVADGRHSVQDRPGVGWSGTSWHHSLWSRPAEPERPRVAPDEVPAPPGGTIPLAQDTSQVVSRLAQLLRDNPTLASSWSREAPE